MTGLVFMWLPMMASMALTSGQNPGFAGTTMANITEETNDQVTTPGPSSSRPLAKVTGLPGTAGSNLTEETANTLTSGTLSSINTSVRTTAPEISTVRESTAMTGTTEASNPTTAMRATPMPSSSTQSQGKGTTSTLGLQTSGASTRPTLSTETGSTAAISTQSGEDRSGSTSPVTGGGTTVAQSTTSPQAPVATIIVGTTTPKRRPGPPGHGTKPNPATNHGRAVAGLIGGALVLMMVAFVVIYLKKRKIQKQQITTTDWAGPSPFLDSGSNSQASRQSSNRISLSSFLPQRMSKRLSLLPETEEELQDMTHATFGTKHQENSFGHKVDENGVQETKGSAAAHPEPASTPEPTEISEDSAPSPSSSSSSHTQNSPSTNSSSDVTILIKSSSDNPPNVSKAVEKAPEQKDSELGAP